MQAIAITGAAGFVGRHVTQALRVAGFTGEVHLFDRELAGTFDGDGETSALDLSQPHAARRVLEGADCVIHLAAMPGAAAEADPAASRPINLDFPLALMEDMAGRRLVLASSIAVFGGALPDPVSDETAPAPQSVYGTHKRMIELAFADAARRCALRGFCLRLPGIVARPVGGSGFGSAFLSEMFHSANERRHYTVPVAPDATSWLMSVRVCAHNIAHAALSPESCGEALTLPCLRVQMGDLARALGGQFDWAQDPHLRRVFGSYPHLRTAAAESFGFAPDADLECLIASVLADV